MINLYNDINSSFHKNVSLILYLQGEKQIFEDGLFFCPVFLQATTKIPSPISKLLPKT